MKSIKQISFSPCRKSQKIKQSVPVGKNCDISVHSVISNEEKATNDKDDNHNYSTHSINPKLVGKFDTVAETVNSNEEAPVF